MSSSSNLRFNKNKINSDKVEYEELSSKHKIEILNNNQINLNKCYKKFKSNAVSFVETSSYYNVLQ